ncbi:helix-turn-helix domain-containing protein [Saccharomonospora piscinae]|uniref:helix-turn-helix domain-containing protein n=1 Tax=Saccharomonospora piscinae TaxID=687388 RepID=UPI00207BB10E|nr:helix-turn-helix transcriptional regulator [Saccharomonospora piscinae]
MTRYSSFSSGYAERKVALSSNFGAQLRLRRREAGLTQEQLSERSGVGVRTIRRLETGERAAPRTNTVRLLADALGLPAAGRDALLAAALGTEAPAAEPSEAPPVPAEPAPERGAPTTTPHRPRPAPPTALAEALSELAAAVGSRWRREEEQRQVQDPFPLPVRWESAAEDLSDHSANVHRVPPGETAPPVVLHGGLADVAPVYRGLPSGRLVVLGREGSGKTILTLRLALDLLAAREPGDPVPVVVGMSSWDPTAQALRDWLTEQLLRDFPGLAGRHGGGTLAGALVEADLVVPVLDGFDEIGQGLRRTALRELNASPLPLLLTSRPAEYADAVAGTDVLTSAAVIELRDLDVADVANYLPRTARKAADGGTVWEPVLGRLRESPPDHAAATLAAVLRTPLMVGLARTVYSDGPGRDPAELLDSTRFSDAATLEAHLFDSYLPTVYRDRPEQARRRRWDGRRVPYWLGYLAHHLDRLGRRDLAWWQLADSLGTSSRMFVMGVVTGVGVGLVEWVLSGIMGVLYLGSAYTPALFFGAEFQDAVHVMLAAGLTFAVIHGLAVVFGRANLAPHRARVRIRGAPARDIATVLARVRLGLLAGLAFGLGSGVIWGVITWVGSGSRESLLAGLINAVVMAVAFAPAAGLAFGLAATLESPLDLTSAARPGELLRTNRGTVLGLVGLVAPVFGLAVALGGGAAVALLEGPLGTLNYRFEHALLWGVVGTVGGGLGYALCLTAWGQWLIFARFWLPLTGRLPWALFAFLDDAYRRGVLRQAGAVHQFRHATLHDHLSRVYRERERS